MLYFVKAGGHHFQIGGECFALASLQSFGERERAPEK